MTDNERFQLAGAFHKELREAKVPHIFCLKDFSENGATFACAGSCQDVIKMIALMIDICSKQIGVSKRDIFEVLTVALGGKSSP